MSDFFLMPFDDFYRSRNSGSRLAQRQRQQSRLSPRGQLACLDDQMFGMGQQLARLQDAMDSTLSQFGLGFGGGSDLTYPNWMDPLWSSMASNCQQKDGKLTMRVPLGENIQPEDLKVSMKDHVMTVEAKKEHVSEDGDSRVYQEYFKKFTLPPNVDMKEVKSTLTPEGYLKIEAPLPQPELEAEKEKQAIQKQAKRTTALDIPIHQG